jgi:uncharacterized protein (TIGR00730 family)
MHRMSEAWERRVCVFCGSSSGAKEEYRAEAVKLGQLLGSAGVGLVYGGAQVGLMGALADAALTHGGKVLGVIPRALAGVEVAHPRLTELVMVETMHERKALMAQEADAFFALPGGFGTLDEFFEILTWAQLGIHDKPCVLINTAGYFDSLLGFLQMAVREGFLKAKNYALIHVASDANEALLLARSHWEKAQGNRPPAPRPVPGEASLCKRLRLEG